MSNFLDTMGTLFSFLFTQLTNVANFFTSNLIGQLILGVLLFSFIVSVLGVVISKFRG